VRRYAEDGCTVRDPAASPHPDLVNRKFTADRPDRLWVTDVTQHPQRLADAQILGDLGDRRGLLPRQLNSTAAELRRVRCRHPDSSPGDQCRQRTGVRRSWGSSEFDQRPCVVKAGRR
jgi:hypothetical protein